MHLYVMQSGSGLIKIGRSRSPDRRRRALEAANGYHVRLVAVLKNAGEREGELHALLRASRKRGEWFAGSLAVQETVSEFFGRPLKFPFGTDCHLSAGREMAKKLAGEAKVEAAAAQAVADILKGSWDGFAVRHRQTWRDEGWDRQEDFASNWNRVFVPVGAPPIAE